MKSKTEKKFTQAIKITPLNKTEKKANSKKKNVKGKQ
jgi:hypothetical protein